MVRRDDPVAANDDDLIVADLQTFPTTTSRDRPLPRRRRGYLGVRSIEMTPELRQHFGAPRRRRAGRDRRAGEPGARAGIQVGDILVAATARTGSTRCRARAPAQGRGCARRSPARSLKKTLAVTLRESRARAATRNPHRESGTDRTASPGRTGSVPERRDRGDSQPRPRFRRSSRRIPLERLEDRMQSLGSASRSSGPAADSAASLSAGGESWPGS